MSIDTSKLPALNLDVESLRTNASDLKTKAGDVRTSGATLNTTWGGMSSCYKAPEQETLYAAMGPVETDCDSLADDLESIAEALSTFADTAELIKKDSEGLKSRAESFLASVNGDPEWQYDQDKVDEHNGFLNEANALQIRMWDAERTCANAIRALDCLIAYHADPTSEDDQFAYGVSAIPDGTAGLPWGSPVERQDHCLKKAGVSVGRAFWDDFCLGTINGLTNLIGLKVGGPDWGMTGETFFGTWRGLSTLVGFGYDEYGNYTGWSPGNAGQAWKGLGKECLHWDQWGTDPLRALTGTVLDVASLLIPVVGQASKVQKFGKAGSTLEKVGKAAQVADKVLSFMDPLGTLAGKAVGKVSGPALESVKNALNIDFNLMDKIGQWTGADVPVSHEARAVSGEADASVPETSTSDSSPADGRVPEGTASAGSPTVAETGGGTGGAAGRSSASEPAHAPADAAHTDASAHGATGGNASHGSSGADHGAGGGDVSAGDSHHIPDRRGGGSGEAVSTGGGHDAGSVAERGGSGADAADGGAGEASHGHSGASHGGGHADHAGSGGASEGATDLPASKQGHGAAGESAGARHVDGEPGSGDAGSDKGHDGPVSGDAAGEGQGKASNEKVGHGAHEVNDAHAGDKHDQVHDGSGSQHHDSDASNKHHLQQDADHSADHVDDTSAHGAGDGHGRGRHVANCPDGSNPHDPAAPRDCQLEDGSTYQTKYSPEQLMQHANTYELLERDLLDHNVRMPDGSAATVDKVREVAGKPLNELTVGEAKLLRQVNDIRAEYVPEVIQKVINPAQLPKDFPEVSGILDRLVADGKLEPASVREWKSLAESEYGTQALGGSVQSGADANMPRSAVDLSSESLDPMNPDDTFEALGLKFEDTPHVAPKIGEDGKFEPHSQVEVRVDGRAMGGNFSVPDSDLREVMKQVENYADLDAVSQDENLWSLLPDDVKSTLIGTDSNPGVGRIKDAVDASNPWRGTGFAGPAGTPNIASPELYVDTLSWLEEIGGGEMWVRGYDGSQELLAVFKAGKWVLVR